MLASLLALGGNFNNGGNVGLYFNLNNAPSDSNINYAARLFIAQQIILRAPLHLAAWRKSLLRRGLVSESSTTSKL